MTLDARRAAIIRINNENLLDLSAPGFGLHDRNRSSEEYHCRNPATCHFKRSLVQSVGEDFQGLVCCFCIRRQSGHGLDQGDGKANHEFVSIQRPRLHGHDCSPSLKARFDRAFRAFVKAWSARR